MHLGKQVHKCLPWCEIYPRARFHGLQLDSQREVLLPKRGKETFYVVTSWLWHVPLLPTVSGIFHLNTAHNVMTSWEGLMISNGNLLSELRPNDLQPACAASPVVQGIPTMMTVCWSLEASVWRWLQDASQLPNLPDQHLDQSPSNQQHEVAVFRCSAADCRSSLHPRGEYLLAFEYFMNKNWKQLHQSGDSCNYKKCKSLHFAQKERCFTLHKKREHVYL